MSLLDYKHCDKVTSLRVCFWADSEIGKTSGFIKKCINLKNIRLCSSSSNEKIAVIFNDFKALIGVIPDDVVSIKLCGLWYTRTRDYRHEKLLGLFQRFKKLEILKIVVNKTDHIMGQTGSVLRGELLQNVRLAHIPRITIKIMESVNFSVKLSNELINKVFGTSKVTITGLKDEDVVTFPPGK